MTTPESPLTATAEPVSSPVSTWFRCAGIFGALFCMTAVLWAAAGVGDQKHPLKSWIGRNGAVLIAIEALVVVVTTVLGMVIPEAESGVRSPSEDAAPSKL
jgi:hypothetical protein